MILYLLQSTLALSVLIAIYFAFLKKALHFQFNRIFLILSLCLGLLAPLLSIELSIDEHSLVDTYHAVSEYYSSIDYSTENVLTLGKAKATPFQRFAYYFALISYGIISGFLLLRFGVYLFVLLRATNRKGPQLKGMQSILLQKKTGPFSFFHYLFISEDQLESIRNNESILLHEKAHSVQKHSLDIVFIEIVHCFLWFNPVLWLYKRAIKENHEFLADEYAAQRHQNLQQYQQDLIQTLQLVHYSPLISSFSYLKIKNRIQMIHTSKPSKLQQKSLFSLTSILALLTLIVCSFKPVALENQYRSISLDFESNIPAILPMDVNKVEAIRSDFGMRISPFTKTKKMHTGVDISAPEGTPIIATADGIIEIAKYASGWGNHVKIKHNDSYQTLYAHLESISVRLGQKVKAGETIGIIGNTGRSLGRHLHYEVIKDDQKVNPADYFQFELTE